MMIIIICSVRSPNAAKFDQKYMPGSSIRQDAMLGLAVGHVPPCKYELYSFHKRDDYPDDGQGKDVWSDFRCKVT